MMNTSRDLPIGIQDFEDLRTGGYVYVDKTKYIYQLATTGKPYFLGRPRRFGKSLLLSTLKAYFLGKKELFNGLAIAELEKNWIEYPVFHIDFNVESYVDLDSFYSALDANLRSLEAKWGKDPAEKTPSIRFRGLIERAYKQTNKKVVVLIDEYDKPLLSTMDDLTLNKEIRKVLKGFYGVLKSCDAYLRFVFLTGVTKFSKVSVFSDLNHLRDMSMREQFAGICGISESELIRDFEPELQALAEHKGITRDEAFAEMKKRYDGYHFAKKSEDIYNPFSVLNTFDANDFDYYWFQTGTPTFLVNMLKKGQIDIRTIDGDISMPAKNITDYNPDNNDPIPLLYQSGYLTVKSYDAMFNSYVLGYPNEEVRYGFLHELLPAYLPVDRYSLNNFFAGDFVKKLMNGDTEGFMTAMQSFFASIPYDLTDKTEKYYQLVFYLLYTLMGQFVQTEVKSANGRADAVVYTANAIYVFEFKMDKRATAEQAIQQIDDKGYLIPYIADGRKLVKIGAEFSFKKRELKRWVVKS
ncbi:MAG: ATP-binding protein [Prevotellaceae bacterium]|nr:ATP-binding protein [Prevotellaceae bacterium]